MKIGKLRWPTNRSSEHPTFREFREAQRLRNLKPEPKWEIETKQTYLNGDWVAKKLSDGWEIVSTQPVIICGNTIKQVIVTVRRPNPRYVTEEAGDGVQA